MHDEQEIDSYNMLSLHPSDSSSLEELFDARRHAFTAVALELGGSVAGAFADNGVPVCRGVLLEDFGGNCQASCGGEVFGRLATLGLVALQVCKDVGEQGLAPMATNLALRDVDLFTDGGPKLFVALDGVDVEACKDCGLLFGTNASWSRLIVSHGGV